MTTQQQIPRGMFFADLRSGIREAMDDLNGVRHTLIESAYLDDLPVEIAAARRSIESTNTQVYLLLRDARNRLRAVSDSFRDDEGKDGTLIPAPEVLMGQRYTGSWRGVIADPSQPPVHDRRAIFAGVPYQAWVDRFGHPNANGGTEWVLRTPAGPATIYPPVPTTGQADPIVHITTWNIGGHSDIVVANLDHALTPEIHFNQTELTSSSQSFNGGLNVFSAMTHWLTEAGLELRDVQAWLNSDWVPYGTGLPTSAANARSAIAGLISTAEALIAEAQASAQTAVEIYSATPVHN